jgi:uncharacterized protein YkwD
MTSSRPSGVSKAARHLSFVAAVVLGACGGGGDAATPAPVAIPSAVGGPTCNIAGFDLTLLARINAMRAAGADCHSEGLKPPVPALTWNALLARAADAHARDMVAKNFFSHTGSDRSTLANRVSLAGYPWSALGENIAAGYSTIDNALVGLMASDGHCANIMEAGFAEVGAVCVTGTPANVYSDYWTIDFGLSR